MFGLGVSEILCIVMIGIVLLGPEHMPGVARKIGGWLAKMRSAATTLNDAIERDETLSSLRKDVLEVQNTVSKAGALVHPKTLLFDTPKKEVPAEHMTGPSLSASIPDSGNVTDAPKTDAATGRSDTAPPHPEDAPGSPTLASNLHDHIERFYDARHGARHVPLSKAILVPSRVARATSRFSHPLSPPKTSTAKLRTVQLRQPLLRRAFERHRLLPAPFRAEPTALRHIALTRKRLS